MTRLGLALLVMVPLAIAVGCRSFMIKTTGTPIGRSLRSGDTIVTLISRLEPYVPSLHRDPGKDRYTISLLIHSARDPRLRRLIKVSSGHRAPELPLMKLLGVEGGLVWYRVGEAGAYDVEQGRLLPAQAGTEGPRPPAFNTSLADFATGDQAVLSMLIAGGQPAPDQWIGVLSQAEAGTWRPGTSIWLSSPVERSREPRHFYRTAVDMSSGKPRVKLLEQFGIDSMLNAGFVRSERQGEILRLDGGGFLLLYESKPYRAGTVTAARVNAAGAIQWTMDTGIGELREILPDGKTPVLIGDRPRIPDKVPEPILVVLDAGTGQAATHSLWLESE